MKKNIVCVVVAISLLVFMVSTPAVAENPPTGLWYGTFLITEGGNLTGLSNCFSIDFDPLASNQITSVSIPDLGLNSAPLPTSITGDVLTINYSPYAVLTGEIVNDSLNGSFSAIVYDPYIGSYISVEGTWQAEKYIAIDTFPSEAPGPPCDNLPPLYCIGDAEYCGELVQFDPPEGVGYIDYPMNGETWDNQYRSYIRRDLMMLIDYATAKVACKSADWDYGNFAPIGLIDMSEADGSIPGSSIGYPGHPPGTHEYGNDIDTAYYQLYTDDNMGRAVGLNHDYHLVEPPYNFDKWRTALFISYLAEHPFLRVVGVDGQIGLILDGEDDQEGTFDELVDQGWIDPVLRGDIPLAYELVEEGLGWFRFHHHHMHVSMTPLYYIASNVKAWPKVLREKSKGRFVIVRLELFEDLDASLVDTNSLALVLSGDEILYAQPDHVWTSDFNRDGIDEITVLFDRQKVLDVLENGKAEIAITGLFDGLFFQESMTIRVVGRPFKRWKKIKEYRSLPFWRPGGRGIEIAD